MENFSERLKLLRKERNLTQKQVGESIGIAEITYRRYEIGLSVPVCDILIKLSNFFNVSLDFLITGKEFGNIIA